MSNIYKEKNGTYTIQISTGVDPLTGKRKRHKRRGFKTQKDAKKYIQNIKNKLYLNKNGLYRYKVIDIYNKYLEDLLYRTKKSTYCSRKGCLDKYLIPLVSHLYLDEIDKNFVFDYKKYLRSLPVHENYKSQIFTNVSTFINFAVKYDYMQGNPFNHLNDFKKSRRKQNVWTIDDLLNFLNHSTKFEVNTFVWVLFMTGIRKGEYRALTWNDIDLANNVLHITKSRGYVSGLGYLTDAPKTVTSIRDVYIDTKTKMVLDNYLQYVSTYSTFSSEDTLLKVGGKEIPNETLRRNFKESCYKAGVPEIRIHDLRHSHVSLLFSSDVNPYTISKRIGHNDIQTTLNIYTHLSKEDQLKPVNLIENKILEGINDDLFS